MSLNNNNNINNTNNIRDKKVAIIGAGPSGTSVLRSFYSIHKKGEDIPQIICYEKQDDWGGLWNYTWRTGLDEYGEPVHGSMYRYLWSNGPKEALEFADYSFEEHFGKPIASYPPREVLADYIKGRVEKSQVKQWVRFRTPVRFVTFDDNTKKFTLISHNLITNKQSIEEFDYVICCSGHFSTPNIPYFQGIEKFGGQVLHSHDFRDAEHFRGKNILIVGSSYSAEDIGSQCWKYGANSITSSYRSRPMAFHWPDNWETKPLLEKVINKQCHFIDGTSKEIDAIILCTGYLHSFPFLSDRIRLITNNKLWIENLYEGTCFRSCPQMFYIGMQDQFYTFNMFDAQAWWVRDVILGKISLPQTSEEMAQLEQPWIDREKELVTDEDKIRYQGSYVEHLLNQVDYPKLDIEGINLLFLEWEHHKHGDIMGFRNRTYRSVVTGNMSPSHRLLWKDALDDSMEEYLK